MVTTDQDRAGTRENDGDPREQLLKNLLLELKAANEKLEQQTRATQQVKKANMELEATLEAANMELEATLEAFSIKNNYTKDTKEDNEHEHEQNLIFQMPRLVPLRNVQPSMSGHKQNQSTIELIVPDRFHDFNFDASNFPFEYKVEDGKRVERHLKVQPNGTLQYSSEAGIQQHTFNMVKDALTCAGLEDLCTPNIEMTLFASRPDIVVVTTNKVPNNIIMCIEVKSPNSVDNDNDNDNKATGKSDVFTNTYVSNQVHTYLMTMKQLGHADPIVCLSTFDKICMASLTNPNDYKNAKNTAYGDFLEDIKKRTSSRFIDKISIPQEKKPEKKDLARSPSKTKCSGESISTSTSTEYDSSGNFESSMLTNLESTVYYGDVIGSGRVFPYLVSALLLAFKRTESEGGITSQEKVSQLLLDRNTHHTFRARRIFPQADDLGVQFVETGDQFTVQYPKKGISPEAKTFLLLETLGQGRSGKVFLACTASGYICALKLYIIDNVGKEKNTEIRDREFNLWQELYSDKYKVEKKMINKFPALLMPYGKEIYEGDRKNILNEVHQLLADLASNGYRYERSDLRWRHVLYDADGNVMLVDLESIGKDENATENVKEDFDNLKNRA